MTTPNAKEGHQAASINSILPKEQSVNYVLLQNTRAYTENDYVSDVLLAFFTKTSNDCTCVTDLYITISLPLSCGLWGFFYIYILPILYKQCLLFGKRLILQNLDSCNSVSPSRFVLWHSRIPLHLHLTNALYKQWLLFENKHILQIFTYKYISSLPPSRCVLWHRGIPLSTTPST